MPVDRKLKAGPAQELRGSWVTDAARQLRSTRPMTARYQIARAVADLDLFSSSMTTDQRLLAIQEKINEMLKSERDALQRDKAP